MPEIDENLSKVSDKGKNNKKNQWVMHCPNKEQFPSLDMALLGEQKLTVLNKKWRYFRVL